MIEKKELIRRFKVMSFELKTLRVTEFKRKSRTEKIKREKQEGNKKEKMIKLVIELRLVIQCWKN